MNSKSNLTLVLDLKKKHDNPIVIFKNNDVYEIIGEDADWCINNIGLHNINDDSNISFVAYVSANTQITSKIINFFKKVIFVEEIPEGTTVQLSLF